MIVMTAWRLSMLPVFLHSSFVKNIFTRKFTQEKKEHDPNELAFVMDGALIRAALILTSSTYLSGFVIYLGGSDFLVGLLDMAQSWAPIVAVFAFVVFERRSRRKPLLLSLLALARLLVCLPIFLPLIFGKSSVSLHLLTVMVIISNMIWGFFCVGHPVWMMNTVSKERSREFIFRRNFWLRLTATAVTIIMGNILDWSGKSYAGFLVIFLSSLLISAMDIAVLLRIPDVAVEVHEKTRFRLADFFEPFAHKDFRNYLFFNFFYFASLMISSAYFSLYLIRYLQIDYKILAIPTALSNIFMFVSIRFWRVLENKIGMKAAFRMSGLMLTIEFGLYVLLNKSTFFLLFLAAPISGIANSGFSIFTFNYRYSLMPEKNRTIYEGWYGAVYGISVLLGPFLGNQFLKWLPDIKTGLLQHSKFQFLFLISFVLGIISLIFGLRERRKK
jgi:hypothetical protein